MGFSRQKHWSRLPFPSPILESQKWKWSCSVVSDSLRPMDCSLPGSSVHGIFQARVLEWVAIAFLRSRARGVLFFRRRELHWQDTRHDSSPKLRTVRLTEVISSCGSRAGTEEVKEREVMISIYWNLFTHQVLWKEFVMYCVILSSEFFRGSLIQRWKRNSHRV